MSARVKIWRWICESKLSNYVLLSTTAVAMVCILFSLTRGLSVRNQPEQPRIIEEGLHLKIDRSSPAFAALEDSLTDYDAIDSDTASPYTPYSILMAGSQSFASQARGIVAANREVIRPQAAPFVVGASVASAVASIIVKGATVVASSDDFKFPFNPDLVPVRRNSRAAAAQSGSYQHPTQVISLAELNIDRTELMRDLFFPMLKAAMESGREPAQIDQGSGAPTGGYGIPGRPSQRSAPNSGRSSGAEPREPRDVQPPIELSKGRAVAGNDRIGTNSNGIVEQASFTGEPVQQLVISGNIQLIDGLAFTSPRDRLVIYREHENESAEAAQVWVKDARYEIFVSRAEGQLVAELQSVNGDVLGRGFMDLAQLPAIERNQYRIQGIHLKIPPVEHDLRGRVVSAYSNGAKERPIAEAEVVLEGIDHELATDKNGRFVEKEIASGSSIIVHAGSTGYRRTLGFAEAGVENEITLYPDKMMGAFVDLVSANPVLASESLEKGAIVWGRATKDGQPVAGAKVELLTGQNEVKPVYFNTLMIPDTSLTETSANGLYAFFPVESGVQGVAVEFAGKKLDPVFFPTEEGFVSAVNLEVETSRTTTLKVFDAFKREPLSARAMAVGGEQSFAIDDSGKAMYRYSAGSGLLIFDVDAGESFAVTRIAVPRNQKTASVPMVDQRWLDDVRNHHRVSKDPDTGTAVGFVEGHKAYKVYLDAGEGVGQSMQVVYFNEKGMKLDTDHGVPGGGYAAFNLPPGFISITAESMDKSGGVAHTATVLAESGFVNVINHTFAPRSPTYR